MMNRLIISFILVIMLAACQRVPHHGDAEYQVGDCVMHVLNDREGIIVKAVRYIHGVQYGVRFDTTGSWKYYYPRELRGCEG